MAHRAPSPLLTTLERVPHRMHSTLSMDDYRIRDRRDRALCETCGSRRRPGTSSYSRESRNQSFYKRRQKLQGILDHEEAKPTKSIHGPRTPKAVARAPTPKKKVQQFHDKDDILVKVAQKMRRVMKKHHMNFESVFNNMDKNADCLVSRGEMRRNFKDAAKMELSTRPVTAATRFSQNKTF